MFSRFDTIPACDGRTDGRTDVKPIAITCFSIADARKKIDMRRCWTHLLLLELKSTHCVCAFITLVAAELRWPFVLYRRLYRSLIYGSALQYLGPANFQVDVFFALHAPTVLWDQMWYTIGRRRRVIATAVCRRRLSWVTHAVKLQVCVPVVETPARGAGVQVGA